MVAVILSCSGVAHAQTQPTEEVVEEIGPSPLYYRYPDIPPTGFFQGAVTHAIDLQSGASAWGFRLAAGVALAMARDPHHVLVLDAGYAYRGFEDHLGSIELRYLFTDADTAADVNTRVGASVSVGLIAGGRSGAVGAGVRVAAAFRWFYALELAYEWLETDQATLEHVLVVSLGGSGVTW